MEKMPNFYVPDPAGMTIEDNALLLLPICDVCGENPSNHMVGDRRLCCKCYVEEGNAPADWHRGCMEANQKKEAIC